MQNTPILDISPSQDVPIIELGISGRISATDRGTYLVKGTAAASTE